VKLRNLPDSSVCGVVETFVLFRIAFEGVVFFARSEDLPAGSEEKKYKRFNLK
jgi:hypothetical protein